MPKITVVTSMTEYQQIFDHAKKLFKKSRLPKNSIGHIRPNTWLCEDKEPQVPNKLYYIGQEVVDLYLKGSNVIFATHNEVAILRILCRVKEGVVNHDDVKFLNIWKNGIQELNVTVDGDFEEKWVNGFFDQRINELFPDDNK